MADALVPSAWRSVHEYFQRGGSLSGFAVVVLGIAAWLILIALIYRWRAPSTPRLSNDPTKLFCNVVAQLNLAVRQRELLHRIAGDLTIEHATTLLLCPDTFTLYARRWVRTKNQQTQDSTDTDQATIRELNALGRILFGQMFSCVKPTHKMQPRR